MVEYPCRLIGRYASRIVLSYFRGIVKTLPFLLSLWVFLCIYIHMHNENVKMYLCLIQHHIMNTQVVNEVQFHILFNRYQMEVRGQLHAPAALLPRERDPCINYTGGLWLPEPNLTKRKTGKYLSLLGMKIRFPVVQPSYYTVWVILAHSHTYTIHIQRNCFEMYEF